MRLPVTIIAFLTALLVPLVTLYIIVPPVASQESTQSTDQVIVKFKQNVSESEQKQTIDGLTISRERNVERLNIQVIKTTQSQVASVVQKLKQDPKVEYAEPDFKATAFEDPNDSLFSQQWGLTKIKSVDGWAVTQGSIDVDIAVVDTGIDSSHPDLVGKVVNRANFTTDSDADGNGHGTHVAGIAAAVTNNNQGIAGVNGNSRLISVKVLDNSGSGYYSWIANGIVWAADNGAEVINLSLGGSSSSQAMQDAINYANAKGVVIVAAAGNSSSSKASYPAYYTPAIAVAATDSSDNKASFSNYGSWVDIAAPGVSIISTYKGSYSKLSGTSMASPFVAGLAGLIKGQHPEWSHSQVRSQIESTADKISKTGSYWMNGRINVCKAVGGCLTVVPSPTPTPTSTPQPTISPTPTPSVSPSPPSPTPTVSPTPSSKPAFCKYLPTHRRCL